MRFRLMATYCGVPYEVGVGPSSSDVVLFAACPPPEELGFQPAPGHWRKHVIRAEVDVLWESRPIGTFHGEPCLVLDDLGDRLHITYLGKDGRRARELGYWQVDRGVFELLTPREEVTALTEEKVEKILPRTGPATPPPPMPSYPYGSAQWPPAPAAASVPADVRGRDGGYGSEPLLAPAGAWNGNGSPNGNDSPNGTGGWNGNDPAGAAPGWNGNDPAAAPGWNGNGPPGGPGAGNWNGSPGAGRWNGNGPPGGVAGSNGNGTLNGTGGWNGAAASPAPARPAAAPTGNPAGPDGPLDAPAGPRRRHAPQAGRRSARKQRVQTRSIFSELADLAAIPRSAYALEQESDGAMCLLRTDEGFEVFSAADGVRHEVRSFDDEEAAYFYLFGVLAAEAIRNGSLTPPG
ncbi:MAG TPA: hypothetical protein VMV92_06535 [Streptosporangiaceae bacterium]|nr:hypothetical protein [Streptosporangiaceae bacterium]